MTANRISKSVCVLISRKAVVFVKERLFFVRLFFFERKFAKKSFFIGKNMVQYRRITNARKIALEKTELPRRLGFAR